MKTIDFQMMALLALLAVFIWFRDTTWMSSTEDTLPILVSIPFFYWLGSPWKFSQDLTFKLTPQLIIVFALLFLLGIILSSTILLTLSWVWLLWNWLKHRVTEPSIPHIQKLLILPIMAFPWVTLDGEKIGWFFRLTGATATAWFYQLLGIEVEQQGTMMMINGLPISVEAACSGLNTLQSMLIAGTAINYILLGDTNRFWWNIPMIIALAWLANTIRIIIVSAAALAWGREFALGEFHVVGGWVVLFIMFFLCWFILSLQEQTKSKN